MLVLSGWTLIVVFLTVFLTKSFLIAEHNTYQEGIESSEMISVDSITHKETLIKAITWNIAAINNNPFEYWITNEDPTYNEIMKNVSEFIENPGANDVPVSKIFSDKMYSELEAAMKEAGMPGLEETRKYWESDYKNRKVITEFIKDPELGKKRLASMPDRVTNTIQTVDQGIVTRPTVINCYSGDLGTTAKWWTAWKQFMFEQGITITSEGEPKKIMIKDLLQPIQKSKYPSITDDEAAISIPLQTVCAAIFDAILVNMMNTIAKGTWQPLREDMCNKLNRKKNTRTLEILETTYKDVDIQFLQEVASNFAKSAASSAISTMYDVRYPSTLDGERDQNSFILLKKGKWKSVKEVTALVLAQLTEMKIKPGLVMNGDLLCLTATDNSVVNKYLLCSFHGDTNGLATIPVVTAVYNFATKKLPDHRLLFGMDANTYATPEKDQQGVVAFAEFYRSKKLNTCYGPYPNPKNFTTFHARTHLQPQLNKAVSLEEKDIKGDKNPKDFVLFFSSDFAVVSTKKDNTGSKKYIENMVFPTLSFPSDHGITSTVLKQETAAVVNHVDSSVIVKKTKDKSDNLRGAN